MHTPIPHRKLGPRTPLLQQLARILMPAVGWQLEGIELLAAPKYVLVVAPHTSNWDLFYGLICAHAAGFFTKWHVGYLIKAEAIRWPVLGQFLHWMGGIAVERHAAQDVVGQVVEVFKRTERLLLAITPEGTRSRREYWKTGFYRIALQAQVPIALAFLDFRRRVGGVGRVFTPTGNLDSDFNIIREFYSTVTAKDPAKFGPISIKPETNE